MRINTHYLHYLFFPKIRLLSCEKRRVSQEKSETYSWEVVILKPQEALQPRVHVRAAAGPFPESFQIVWTWSEVDVWNVRGSMCLNVQLRTISSQSLWVDFSCSLINPNCENTHSFALQVDTYKPTQPHSTQWRKSNPLWSVCMQSASPP